MTKAMDLNRFPNEILFQILETTAELNQKEGVSYTFGLTQTGYPVQNAPQRYVRGPVPPALLKWDAASALRMVCRRWHEWGIHYAMKNVYVKAWRGSERWCDLSIQRDKYKLYELIEKPRGERVYRDPWLTLRRTKNLFTKWPLVAQQVRRLWFDGLYNPETDTQIIETIKSCTNLTSVSLPWTVLRHGSAQDWAGILGTRREFPLRSLELLAVNLSDKQMEAAQSVEDQHPLDSAVVNFSQLRRLKLFGDTAYSAINDDDLKAIARTATNLQEFHITCMSTVSIEGVMAIVKASKKTIRVLEHSPRSQDGFYHPDPGSLSENEHICHVLTSCPKLEDLSISLPSMCSELFANERVQWKGDCQVRALRLCGHEEPGSRAASGDALRKLLRQARNLISKRATSSIPAELRIELFFADFIFDPHIKAVHGDFETAELFAPGSWPAHKERSRKGPYGSTGLYGKDEEYTFEKLNEDEFFRGLDMGVLRL
ncbi:hypothetical protein EJ06DRAFT_530371 [Trichodelitschia bisporula]|uniref:F-box domain-containing protein n=1 Tax=Trichodelitschia bisporula TaxID=703511 RepID=A0A6G1HX46_9PEZI|nr:hypothetical protein EJ06DRAFT_530371 [Trichodelitschia bisporula]